MRRLVALGAGVLLLLLVIGTAFLGCGGGAAIAVASITLTPSAVSLNRGATAQITAQAEGAEHTIIGTPVLAYSSDNPAIITVSNSGLICAGQWDANHIVCQTSSNNNLLPIGTANITATATINNQTLISSAVVVAVHEPIDSVQIVPSPGNPLGCVSQNGVPNTAQFTAQAFSHDPAACARIPGSPPAPCRVPDNTIGSINWEVSPGQVATADAAIHAVTDPVTVTAASPGQGVVAGLVGAAGSLVSGAAPFTTCGVASIHVHQQNMTPIPPDTATSFTAPIGATVSVVADVFDTKGVGLNNTIALGWTSFQPALAAVSPSTTLGGTVEALAPGTASITAACIPPSCNVNLNQAIYSDDVVTAIITGTLDSTVLVTTNTAPASSTSSNNIVPIDTTTNTPGTAFLLPANLQVNSMVTTPLGNPAFLGTLCASGTSGPNGAACSGLLRFDPTVATVTAPITTITGTVLATDGIRVVLADPANNQTLIATAGGPGIEATLPIGNATAAAITAVGTEIYIVAGSKLFIYSPGLPLQSRNLSGVASASSQAAAFFATGAMAYVADSGADVVATCTNNIQSTVAVGTPSHIAAVPNATAMVDANSPNIDEIDASSSGGCPPTITNSFVPATNSHGFTGVAGFTAKQLIVTPGSNLAIILTSDHGVLVYDLGTKLTSVITLTGGPPAPQPLSGGVTPDGATLYVGATDGKVHRVDLKTLTDAQSIAVSLCPSVTTGCTPDFLVVRPVATVATLSSIAVTPANPSVGVSTTQQFTATGTFSDKTTRDLTNFVVWGSSNTAVAIIGPNTTVTPALNPGQAQALASGTTTISATSAGVTGSTTLTVK